MGCFRAVKILGKLGGSFVFDTPCMLLKKQDPPICFEYTELPLNDTQLLRYVQNCLVYQIIDKQFVQAYRSHNK